MRFQAGTCICKIHEIAVPDIHLTKVITHQLYFGISRQVDQATRSRFQQVQAIEQRSCCPIPIMRSFVATTVFGITVNESVERLKYQLHVFQLFFAVGLGKQYTSQPVGTDPGIPVHGSHSPPLLFPLL